MQTRLIVSHANPPNLPTPKRSFLLGELFCEGTMVLPFFPNSVSLLPVRSLFG